jgi:hypothetical protein
MISSADAVMVLVALSKPVACHVAIDTVLGANAHSAYRCEEASVAHNIQSVFAGCLSILSQRSNISVRSNLAKGSSMYNR